MQARHILVGLAVVGLLAIMMPGCGSKVSKGNYEKIKEGMTVSEVEDILGKGKKEGGEVKILGVTVSGEAYVWEDGDKKITVVFKDGKVTQMAAVGLE
jgi:hypothetical protein